MCTLAATATATAATALGPPAGWPDLAGAALGPADLGSGALVASENVKPDSSFLAEYDREFKELTVRVNDKRLLGVENDVSIGKTAAAADFLIQVLPLGLAIASDQIGSEFAKEAHLKPTYTTAKRIRAGMAPHSSVSPSVASTAEVGQTLTAQTGTWLGFPTGYSFQWDRCDATGANCSPIAGATATTYLVSTDDVNMTLRVDVGALNLYGSGLPASSSTTGVVPTPPPATP